MFRGLTILTLLLSQNYTKVKEALFIIKSKDFKKEKKVVNFQKKKKNYFEYFNPGLVMFVRLQFFNVTFKNLRFRKMY